jgi:DNA-binding response OmpR family regulator
LAYLAGSPKQVFSREQLLSAVWDSSSDWQDEATVTEHVRRLRRKIEGDPDHPRWVVTVRGVGYRFVP